MRTEEKERHNEVVDEVVKNWQKITYI